MKEYPVKTIATLIFGAILLGGFAALLLVTYGAGPQALFERAITFYSFARNHAWMLLGLYVLRLLFFLPASFVLFLTGMICGTALGELIAVVGLTLSGSLEFLVVRSSFSAILSRSPGKLLLGWHERVNRAPFHSILLMRVCFVPFDAVNIAAALARAPFRPFVLATALGIAPTSLPIVISGASVNFQTWAASGRFWPGEGAVNWQYLLLSFGLMLMIVLHARRRARLNPRNGTSQPMTDLPE
ncbi:TVP38/TMEM64 family protein [Nevskia soli]|uniref:TVP38/TMEM64 family protein n=1 Tax=Nevskia soli TaxID=418856 RepID=UPI0009FBF7D3|nr:VTT domain-containing protein [Nevskia soli]